LFLRTCILPGRYMTEVPVVALCFAIRRLMLFSKMPAARLFTSQRILHEKLGEFEKISKAAGMLEILVEGHSASQHLHVPPKLLSQLANPADCGSQTCGGPRHAAIVPHDLPE